MSTGIEYLTDVINPLGFGCYGVGGTPSKPNICYEGQCWAKRMASRNLRSCADCRAFRPHWHPEQLEKIAHWCKPRRIGVQFTGDLFEWWTPEEQIRQVIAAISVCPQHSFFLLTKNPRRMRAFTFPPNAWVGTTVENEAAIHRVDALINVKASHRWLSVEPLLGAVLPALRPYLEGDRFVHFPTGDDGSNYWYLQRHIEWVVIGAESGPGATIPSPEWATELVDLCRVLRTPVWMKENLSRYRPPSWDYGELVRQVPPYAQCPTNPKIGLDIHLV